MTPYYWSVWLDEALRLEAENFELRVLLVALLVELARSRDLRAFAAEAIEARFPTETKGGARHGA